MMVSHKNLHLETQKNYFLAIVLLAAVYLVFEVIFIPHAALWRDEFWFSHHIYQYLQHLPYRDFLPYKPVLGYYLLTIPMLFSHAVLTPLYYIKDEIALINALCIAASAMWAARFFQPKAIFLTLSIIISSQLFLTISSEIRVDMLSSWFALFSVLYLLSNRPSMSGLVLGFAFLISQKVLWFFVASNAALGFYWLLIQRSREQFKDIIRFNILFFAIIGCYIAVWSYFSNLHTVMNSVFYEGFIQAKITWYHWMYYSCWQAILSNGPLYVLLWPLTWISLFGCSADKVIQKRRILITVYAAVMLLLIAAYQQAFAYNMVFLVPAFFVLYADFFSWMFTLFNTRRAIIINHRQLFWFSVVSCLFAISLIIMYGLPYAYFIILLIPVCLALMILYPNDAYISSYKGLAVATIIFMGIIYPLASAGNALLLSYNYGQYQKYNIRLVHDLLEEGGEYFAGTPLLYQKDQAIPGLKNLIGPAVDYLNTSNPAILPVLIDSLYLTPKAPQQILQSLKEQPVKLYVNNDRVERLPKLLHRYLLSQYQHFSGSVYLYAPEVVSGQHNVNVKFTGNYTVQSQPGLKARINKKVITNNGKVFLKQGHYKSKSNYKYRLVYVPNVKNIQLNERFQRYARNMLGSG